MLGMRYMQCVILYIALQSNPLITMLSTAVDTLFCLDCEQKQPQVHVESSNAEKHSLDHFLLRLHDSVEAKAVRMKTSNKQLDDVKASIHVLEGKMDEQLHNMKTVLENVVKDMAQDRAMITPFFKAHHTVEHTNGKVGSDQTPSGAQSLVTLASPQTASNGNIESTKSPEEGAVSEVSVTPCKIEPPEEEHITALESRLGARLTSLESKVEEIMLMMKAVLTATAQHPN